MPDRSALRAAPLTSYSSPPRSIRTLPISAFAPATPQRSRATLRAPTRNEAAINCL